MNERFSLSRRGFIGGAAVGTAALAAGCGSSSKASSTTTAASTGVSYPHPTTPSEATALLQAGNQRYVAGTLELRDYSPDGEKIASTQAPFAAIIACADSRISPAIIFDVHHGNLFVSRIAGNTVDTGTLGSTEYAVEVLGVKVIMVLGHSDCGAVKSAIKVAHGEASYPPDKYGAIGPVIDAIVPTVKSLPPDQQKLAPVTLANAQAQAKILAAKDPIIAPAVAAGKVHVVSAVYDIGTGTVSL
jgi:carbonic anhydrase